LSAATTAGPAVSVMSPREHLSEMVRTARIMRRF